MRTIAIVLPWRAERDIRYALSVLDLANRGLGPPPSLYSSRVRYVPERVRGGEERFETWPVILEEGEADCDGLGSYLATEFFYQGYEEARSTLSLNEDYYHVQTDLGGGIILDPSVALGMYQALARQKRRR